MLFSFVATLFCLEVERLILLKFSFSQPCYNCCVCQLSIKNNDDNDNIAVDAADVMSKTAWKC